MKTKISEVVLWAKVGVFAVVVLYGLLVVGFNFRAVVSPGLRLPLIAHWENPNAIVTILLTGVLSVGIFWLVGSFYRAVWELKKIKTQERLIKAERELDELKGRKNPSESPGASNAGSGPIPLEPTPDKSEAEGLRPKL